MFESFANSFRGAYVFLSSSSSHDHHANQWNLIILDYFEIFFFVCEKGKKMSKKKTRKRKKVYKRSFVVYFVVLSIKLPSSSCCRFVECLLVIKRNNRRCDVEIA